MTIKGKKERAGACMQPPILTVSNLGFLILIPFYPIHLEPYQDLSDPISYKEVKSALNQSLNGKAPGLNTYYQWNCSRNSAPAGHTKNHKAKGDST
jgi:hypothetical protein